MFWLWFLCVGFCYYISYLRKLWKYFIIVKDIVIIYIKVWFYRYMLLYMVLLNIFKSIIWRRSNGKKFLKNYLKWNIEEIIILNENNKNIEL